MYDLTPRILFKDWRDFEEYVYGLLCAVKPALENHNMEVYRHKKLQGTKGKWEVDVAYEFEILGVTHLVIVECKCYSRKATRRDVTNFLVSADDLSASKGLLVSNQTFTSGAKELASGTSILLLTSNEFFNIIENDLANALAKELNKQIMDMRDEAIYVSIRFGLNGIHGRFHKIQSFLS